MTYFVLIYKIYVFGDTIGKALKHFSEKNFI
jgi:hypothetical protein